MAHNFPKGNCPRLNVRPQLNFEPPILGGHNPLCLPQRVLRPK